MFGVNKIVVSKDQKELVNGIAKYTGSVPSEISYNIIEFGVAFLISLSFERRVSENDDGITVAKLILMWKEKPETIKFSDAVVKFLKLENKKDYIRESGWFASFTGVHLIGVAREQKETIRICASKTKIPERDFSHCVFESGVTFMMLAESSPEEVSDVIREWLYDDDIMKVAHSLRNLWEAGKEDDGVSAADSVDMSKYGLKGNVQIKKGIENMQDDTYFIRRKSDGYFAHFEKDFGDTVLYLFKEGAVGACGWHKKEAELFLQKQNLLDKAELVNAKEFLLKEKDKSENQSK